jgi:hypothetical protein
MSKAAPVKLCKCCARPCGRILKRTNEGVKCESDRDKKEGDYGAYDRNRRKIRNGHQNESDAAQGKKWGRNEWKISKKHMKNESHRPMVLQIGVWRKGKEGNHEEKLGQEGDDRGIRLTRRFHQGTFLIFGTGYAVIKSC